MLASPRLSPAHAQAHLDLHIFMICPRVHVEMCNLRAQACLHLLVHLVAGLHECPSQIHVVSWQAMVDTQSQRPWQEAHQVVHLGTETAMGKFSHEGELSGLRLPKQMCFYPLNGFNIVFQQPVNSKSAYSKLSQGTVFLRATGPGASLGLTHTQAL